jgi:serine-protein kinase ATM
MDGMGPLGTKGLFTKAAEMTLSALKSNSSALLTILSAIVADPLYKWTLQTTDDKDESKNEAKRNSNGSRGRGGTASTFEIQHGDTNRSRNEAAEHAIQKINEKLQGYEDGTSGEQQSVAGQVSFLINSAQDIDNLCVMFPGWAPWV